VQKENTLKKQEILRAVVKTVLLVVFAKGEVGCQVVPKIKARQRVRQIFQTLLKKPKQRQIALIATTNITPHP
jgi:hypothetical protein